MQTPLKLERSSRGKESTYDVASALGIAQSHYSRIENGESRPSPDLAARIALYFGHSVTEMQILYPERYTVAQAVETNRSEAA